MTIQAGAPRSPRGRRSPGALPRRKPSLGELVAVAFALFVVVPALFSAIGLVAFAAQDVEAVWLLNLILVLTTCLFVFFFLRGLRLAARLIRMIDKK
ncbi:MAG: hypothetical protein H0V09_03035 [Gemmatimonadetes bacterium]|nr:hypothetical protein [Gemmatimonadota bacterium]